MTTIDEHGRTAPPVDAGEAETLVGFLEYQRATFAWKSDGLGQDDLRRSVAASTMTLGGMLKHLALVEDWWCSQWLAGNEPASFFSVEELEADPGWEWRTAADDAPDSLRQTWRDAVARSRVLVSEALAQEGPDRVAVRRGKDGWTPNLRWILCHLIEEYARHNGHADLIREAIDGSTGE